MQKWDEKLLRGIRLPCPGLILLAETGGRVYQNSPVVQRGLAPRSSLYTTLAPLRGARVPPPKLVGEFTQTP
jgi:hypothetical protein